MKTKGIIFDLDGVIVSTDEYHYQAWKKLADKEEIYFDRIINNRLRGVSRMESLNIILERATKSYSDEQKLLMATEKNENYRNSLYELTPDSVDPETLDALKKIKKLGLKIAIASSSKNTRLILERIGLIDFFDAIADGNDIKHSKPHPEVFLTAAERLYLKPEECIIVEDAFAGIDAGIAGNFRNCGIGDAYKYDKTMYPIKSLKDILKYID